MHEADSSYNLNIQARLSNRANYIYFPLTSHTVEFWGQEATSHAGHPCDCFIAHPMLPFQKEKKSPPGMEVYCAAALQSVMATAQPAWNASALLGRRKGYLCFLHITVTQTRSFKLFCSLDGLHNSLPNLHNNKLKKGGARKKALAPGQVGA